MANRLLAFASDGVYVARRSMTVHGVQLSPGQALPSDSPLRKNPRRIEQMCQNRQLIPGALSEKKGPNKKVAEAATPSATPVSVPPLGQPEATGNRVKKSTPEPKAAKPAKVAKPKKLDIESLSKVEIVKQLEDLGLRTNGSKEQLVERLKIALE